MSFFGFGQSADIEILLDGTENRPLAEIKTEDGKKERHLLYYDGESVTGKVNVKLKKPGSKLEHQGIKIEFIGQIELYYDRGNHHEFTSLVKELARPGELMQNTIYNFEFLNVEKPFESYTGCNVRLRYLLRVTIVRRLSDIVKEQDIIVHTLSSYPEMNNSIKMEVGIEDCLHIEFEYNKSKYHLKDVIVGKIYFLLVRIKLKHMEIAIIKREATGSGPNTFMENDTIVKYEIMDGAPVRGESIPIRVFLGCYDLTPTMKDINKKFSVKYFLNLVLMDEEDRRYFKQQEITLWRKGEKAHKGHSLSPHQPTHLVAGEGGPKGTNSSGSVGGRDEEDEEGENRDERHVPVPPHFEDLQREDDDEEVEPRKPSLAAPRPAPRTAPLEVNNGERRDPHVSGGDRLLNNGKRDENDEEEEEEGNGENKKTNQDPITSILPPKEVIQNSEGKSNSKRDKEEQKVTEEFPEGVEGNKTIEETNNDKE